jgi:hypothetical protein
MEILMADAQPDAIALLKADHRKVEDLFARFEPPGKPTKRSTSQDRSALS